MDADLIQRLCEHRTIGSAPRAELEWLAARGTLHHFEPGDIITQFGKPLEYLYITLSAHFALYVDRGGASRRVTEWGAGDVGGVMPYSRMVNPPGKAVVEDAGDVFMVHRDHFPELVRACPDVTAKLVHAMIDRARVFNAMDLQNEKMMSLGRLAAGLAHELNNPASAAARSAKLLVGAVEEAETAAQAFGAADLSESKRAAVNGLRRECLRIGVDALSPIARSDRQDALADWLADHDQPDDLAEALADGGLTPAALDALAAELGAGEMAVSLRWLAAGCSLRRIAAEVAHASSRIHDLVGSIKRFTYMDRHAVPEAVDVVQGLRDSIAVHAHKAREKSVHIALDLDEPLPKIDGFGGELNQVWGNLIDNALDAVQESSGRVDVRVGRDASGVVVRIVDNGEGIKPEIRQRIFDPFFTSKPQGQGTGLGLGIAQKIVERHHGEISVQSEPGHTEFRVWLPAAGTSPRKV